MPADNVDRRFYLADLENLLRDALEAWALHRLCKEGLELEAPGKLT